MIYILTFCFLFVFFLFFLLFLFVFLCFVFLFLFIKLMSSFWALPRNTKNNQKTKMILGKGKRKKLRGFLGNCFLFVFAVCSAAGGGGGGASPSQTPPSGNVLSENLANASFYGAKWRFLVVSYCVLSEKLAQAFNILLNCHRWHTGGLAAERCVWRMTIIILDTFLLSLGEK